MTELRQLVRNGRAEVSVRCATARDDAAPHLLLLHALGGSSDDWGDIAALWPGEVFAVDFCGHGASDWLGGRGYMPEIFAADADAVLVDLAADRPVRVAGAGIGAYVALLLAGARRDLIDAALLLPGRGLDGGGALPDHLTPEHQRAWLEEIGAPERQPGQAGPDPLVQRCSRDLRPVAYAESFAQSFSQAGGRLLVAEVPDPPPWLDAVVSAAAPARTSADPSVALAALAAREIGVAS